MGNYTSQLVGHYADVHKRLVNGVVPSRPKTAIVIPIRQDTEGQSYPSKLEAQLIALKLSVPQAKKVIGIFADLINEFIEKPKRLPRAVTIDQICELVCNTEKLTKTEIFSDRRYSKAKWPRFIICYLAWEFTGSSFGTIGQKLGGRDHSTIMNGRNRVAHRRQIDEEFNVKLNEYEARLINEFGAEVDKWRLELQPPTKKH